MAFSNSSDNKYFAAKSGKETADYLVQKGDSWYLNLMNNGYLDKLKMMWSVYYGAQYTNFQNAHQVVFGGEQGELSQITINHIRNLANTIISMLTATRPAMQARAINTDYKSLVQTKLANGLLDYYMRDKRLEKYLHAAVESAVVLGSGYIKLEWNSMTGEVYDISPTGTEVREGDIQFTNLSPFDVFFDINREDDNHDWVVTRSFKNRFDVAAKYPEYSEQILNLPTKNDLQGFYMDRVTRDDTDLIPVYEFFHKRTESMSDGRYLLYLSDDIVLMDTPMPYRALPIYMMKFAGIMGTPLAYTDMFDLVPIQDAVNAMYSAILTNNSAFAVQNVLVPRGSDINVSELAGSLSVIDYNAQAGKPEPLQLTATPNETYNFVGMLEKVMETISGVNAVSRGKPDPQLRSGNALALLQSMTLQYISKLQQSYIMLIEDMGTGIVNVLKDFAAVPRVATIVGNRNRSYMKEFTGDDLSSVNRVIVDIANPLANSSAGRVEMADNLLQMGLLKTPEDYFTVLKTGQLDVMTEDTQSELFLVRGENERLMNGQPVAAMYVDQHALHIREHSAILSDPELRFNPELLKRVQEHIQEHISLLQTTDPNLLQILGQQPLAPPGGSPIGPQNTNQPNNPSEQMSDMMGLPQGPMPTQMEQMGASVNLPKPAQPPQIPGQLLPQPTTPEQLLMRNTNGQ